MTPKRQGGVMGQVVRIETEPGAFTPDPITDAEAAALLRASLNLFARWGLSDSEAAVLLDVAPRTLSRWKAGSPGRIDRDQRARMSNLIAIHKALRIVFREAERGYAWIRKPNATFGGRTALAVMLNGELTDLMRVRRYLDAERGGW
jgi:Antitoxin Xre/MbcA/ParS C-terminal toxin-binding domain/Antitoxin Xre-like helix-turn-helix domain